MPKNATINGDGFRMYAWQGGDTEVNRAYNAVEPSDLLSVTSIRTLAGTPFQLVAWQIANVVNLAMGVRKQTVIGPRGGVREKYVPDGVFPGEFVARMLETRGQQTALDDLRRWLRESADEPRDIAAVRGSVVHKMIEMNLPLTVIDRDVIIQRMIVQWADEKKRKQPADITDDDVNFVFNALRNYWDMRTHVPFVIIAQEPQVYNLSAGYGGSADVLLWFLGNWGRNEDGEVVFTKLRPHVEGKTPRTDVEYWQKKANAGEVTAATIEEVGGQVAVGDWKTSKGVYTNHVVQTTAYMAGEFIAEDGIIDERLSDILAMAMLGMVIHIRPDSWAVDLFEFRQDVVRAFLGSVAFARFLAQHKTPNDLFIYALSGKAEGVEESEIVDGAE